MHGLAAHGFDLHHDQAVVEQQHITGLDVTRQLFVVQAHAVDVARLGAAGIQHKFLSGL